VKLSWLENAYSLTFFHQVILIRKVGHTDLVFGVDIGSLVGLCMQDYKLPCATVTICATPVDPKFDFCIFTEILKIRSTRGK